MLRRYDLSVHREPARSDQEMVEACLRGDATAWEQLVRRYSSLVYSIPLRFGLNEEDATDVFQKTWCAVWEGLAEVREQRRLSVWIIKVASRLAHQQTQRLQRELVRSPESDIDLGVVPDEDAPLDDLAIALDESDALRGAMARLPSRCRELLQYLFYDPGTPTYEEIGARMGVSADSVGSQRSRCLQHLRGLLAENPVLARKQV